MIKFKDIFLDNKRLISSALIHSGLMWASLALAYNSYKEYMRGMHHILPPELKVAIKVTFPWAIIIFLALFVLCGIGRDKKDDYPSFRHYTIIFALQASIANLIFFSKGTPILIVQNFALLYLAGFLFIGVGMKRFIFIDTTRWAEDVLPPIIYKPLQRKMPGIREYCKAYIKERPSARFIIGFMVLLMICALLLIFKQEKAAENLANIAYFLLVIGVGIEVYELIKYGERNNGE